MAWFRKMSKFKKGLMLGALLVLLPLVVVAARYEVLNVTKLYVDNIYGLAPGSTGPTLNGVTVSGTGVITATNVADVSREDDIPLTSFHYNDATDASPAWIELPLSNIDSIPAFVWASPAATHIQTTFRVPSIYVSGMAFRALTSRSTTATASVQEVAWCLWVNTDGANFQTASIPQSTVAQSTANYGGASNEVITLTPNATAVSAIAAGTWVTLEIWRQHDGVPRDNGNLELKGISKYYTATQ